MLADNFLRCDAAGSCMMGDSLATKDNMSFNIGVPGMGSMGFSTADNFLRADSTGNVMMGDDLAMLGANGAGQRMMFDSLATKDNAGFNIGVPGMGSIGANWADNYLRCDSAGNCMMGDDLKKAHIMRKFKHTMTKTAKVAETPVKKVINNADHIIATGTKAASLVAADNFLRCDSAGNCMMDDSLATKDNMSFNIGVPGMGSMGFSTADNFLRADSAGNVMMGDKLAMSCDS